MRFNERDQLVDNKRTDRGGQFLKPGDDILNLGRQVFTENVSKRRPGLRGGQALIEYDRNQFRE